MPYVTAKDGTRLYYEECGTGTPIVFVHEYAGDYRTWEPQVRHFSRQHRCVTFSARGYPPSDIPRGRQALLAGYRRGDVIAVMDGLGIDKAHVVGHSMGAYTTLHVGIRHPERCLSLTAAGCGWGSNPAERDASKALVQGDRPHVPRGRHRGCGGQVRRLPDAARIQAQGPARLGGVRDDAGRALGYRQRAHDAARAARAADAVGAGGRPEEAAGAAAGDRRRRGRRLPRRQPAGEAPRTASRPVRDPARQPHDHRARSRPPSTPRSPTCSRRWKPAGGWRIANDRLRKQARSDIARDGADRTMRRRSPIRHGATRSRSACGRRWPRSHARRTTAPTSAP